MARNIVLNEEKDGVKVEIDAIKRVYVRYKDDLDDCFVSTDILNKLKEDNKASILKVLKEMTIDDILLALDEIEVFPRYKELINTKYNYDFPLGALKVLSFSKHSFAFKDVFFPGFIEIIKEEPSKRLPLLTFKGHNISFDIDKKMYVAGLKEAPSLKKLIMVLKEEAPLDNRDVKEELLASKDRDIENSLLDIKDNFKVDLIDSKKLIVKHLPYTKASGSIINIPKLEYKEYLLVEGIKINLNKYRFVVKDILFDKVILEVLETKSIFKDDGVRLAKGEQIELSFDEALNLKLKEEDAQESWEISLVKESFDKELRFIDYHKIMDKINKLDYVKKYTDIERLELEKSLILFLYFIMQNHDYESLDKLYSILKKTPSLYEEYMTKYNVEEALKEKDNLKDAYSKKTFMEKVRLLNMLIKANYLTYPRFIFEDLNYFDKDDIMQRFKKEKQYRLQDDALKKYLEKEFIEYDYYQDLDKKDKANLDKILLYLSILYKNNLSLGETIKYRIERGLYDRLSTEDLSLLISKIIMDTMDASLRETYKQRLDNLYLIGKLNIPLYDVVMEVNHE